jgi:hypothetical protein
MFLRILTPANFEILYNPPQNTSKSTSKSLIHIFMARFLKNLIKPSFLYISERLRKLFVTHHTNSSKCIWVRIYEYILPGKPETCFFSYKFYQIRTIISWVHCHFPIFVYLSLNSLLLQLIFLYEKFLPIRVRNKLKIILIF